MGGFDEVAKNQSRKGLIMFLQKANMGQPIERLYDDTQCHDVHSFHHLGADHVIFSTRCGNTPRVYWMYGEGREIVLITVVCKTKKRLSVGDKEHLAELAKPYIEAVHNNNIVYL